MLRNAGHDAVHVFDVGMHQASDDEVVEYAAEQHQIIVSSDTDFGAILARRGSARPSFVLLRHQNELTPTEQAELLVMNLPDLAVDLEAGAVATLARSAVRLRRLPFRQKS
jgi:predicted nuclease of predicted toxin-antitoxin system